MSSKRTRTHGLNVYVNEELDESTSKETKHGKKPLHPAERFRIEQAVKASFHPDFEALKPGTPEFRIACEVLLAFPKVRKPRDSKVGITTLAVNVAMRKMSGSDLKNMRRIHYGISIARKALKESYDLLKAADKAAPATPLIMAKAS